MYCSKCRFPDLHLFFTHASFSLAKNNIPKDVFKSEKNVDKLAVF